jgi:hypothetical protein
MGNKGVTLAANLLLDSYLANIMTCHKVMRAAVFRSLQLDSRGLDIEPEITGKLPDRSRPRAEGPRTS